jgi:hypothetical protein
LRENRFFKEISLCTNEKGRWFGMGEKKKCPLFRKPESLSMGKGIGYCDMDSSNTTCEADVIFCERPDALRVYLRKKIEEFYKKKD